MPVCRVIARAYIYAQVIFTNPAKLGDTLTATAQIVRDGGRTASCDVEVTNQMQKVIVRGQGVNYRVKKPVIE